MRKKKGKKKGAGRDDEKAYVEVSLAISVFEEEPGHRWKYVG